MSDDTSDKTGNSPDNSSDEKAVNNNAISQMQMLFVPEEDRVLFRVNSADGKQVRFWLTRRYMQLLQRALRTHLDADPDVSVQSTPDAKQAVQSFKQEQAIQGADFKKQFNETPNELPLGESALLAFRLNYRVEKDVLHLGIEPKAGQGINLAINRDINVSLSKLIQNAVTKADWRLSEAQPLVPEKPPIVN